MKKMITFVSSLLCGATMMAQETKQMNVWMADGSVKTYDIANVDSVTFSKVAENPGGGDQGGDEPTNPTTPSLNAQLRATLQTFGPQGYDTPQGYTNWQTYYYPSQTRGINNTPVTVLLPPSYDPNNKDRKYPVCFVLHGIGGNHESMKGMGVQDVLANSYKNGTPEMILVLPDMYTCNDGNRMQFTQAVSRCYDNFINDIRYDLIPFIEANFNAATGRENRAITGFSMGGREAVYIGSQSTDIIGYVGGACCAPGIVPTRDYFMEHEGSIKNEADFKIPDGKPLPYLFLISGGTNDGTVGNYPEQYHNILERNGVDHVWHSIPGTGHDENSVKPHLYNYFRYVFQAK